MPCRIRPFTFLAAPLLASASVADDAGPAFATPGDTVGTVIVMKKAGAFG